MADRESTTSNSKELIDELCEALEKIVKRATPHVDDTAEDRQRDLFHVDAIARRALAKARATQSVDEGGR